MNKKIIAILMVALVAFASGVFAQEKVTLNVLNYADATQAGYSDEVALWAKFQADNPDITIVKEELNNEPFHQKVATYVAAGQMPDVFYSWPGGRSTAVQKKHLAKDLSKLLPKDLLALWPAAALNPKAQDSGYLSELPRAITYTSVMYTNVKLLKDNGLAIPKTYAELKRMVPKLKAKGIIPVAMANKDTWVMQSCLFSTISGRIAGDAFIDQVLAGKAKFTDKPFVAALTFVDTLYKDGVISRDSIQTPYGDVPGIFASGKAAFLIDGDWRQAAFLTDKTSGTALISPAAQKSDFALVEFPAIPGEKNPGLISAVLGTGMSISAAIPAGSAKAKAAVKLLTWWYGKEWTTMGLETGAYIPARKDIKSDKVEPFTTMMSAYYASVPKTGYVLDGVLDAAVCTPLNDGLQQIGLGTKTPAAVASDMQAAFDTWKAAQK